MSNKEIDPEVFVHNIFNGAATSLVETQKKLDNELKYNSLFKDIYHGGYSIPKVDLEIKFSTKQVRNTYKFFAGKNKKLRKNSNLFKFSIVTSPEPTELSDDAEDKTVYHLTQPSFLLVKKEEDEIYELLFNALKSKDSIFITPPGSTKTDEELEDIKNKLVKEADKIKKAKENNDTNAPNNKGFGRLLFFRLFESKESYLIIRILGKKKKPRRFEDGIFILTPGNQPAVEVYNYEGGDNRTINYRALHRFVLTIRKWINSEENRSFTLGNRTKMQFGIAALNNYISQISKFYTDGLKSLMQKKFKTFGLPTTYYDLPNVETGLYYSHSDNQPKAMRSKLDRLEGADNQVLIKTYLSDGIPNIDVELKELQFIVAGEERSELIKQIVEKENSKKNRHMVATKIGYDLELKKRGIDADDIKDTQKRLDAFNKVLTSIRSLYKGSIRAAIHQKEVVIFSSISSNNKVYLIIWPGITNGKKRDFVFMCKKPIDGSEFKTPTIQVSRPNILFPDVVRLSFKTIVSDTIMGVDTDTDKVAIRINKDYEFFHNIFLSVRDWRSKPI